MSVEVKDIRNEVKKFIDHADDKTVKMIYAMLEVEHNEDMWTDAGFVAEMDRRTKEFESGTAKLISLNELEQNARAAYKKENNEHISLSISCGYQQ